MGKVTGLLLIGGAVASTLAVEHRESLPFWPETQAGTAKPTTPPEAKPSNSPKTPETSAACTDISKLSPEIKAGQLIFVIASAESIDKVGGLAKYRIGNFALSGSLADANKAAGAEPSDANAIGKRIKTAKTKLEKATKLPVSVALDEEGGQVQRTSGLKGAQKLPSARTQTKDMLQSKITKIYYDHGRFLLEELGVMINFAPVADVGNGTQLGDRTYGTDVDAVVRNARVAIKGMKKAGISPTIKHFPGLGGVNGDSHDKPVTTMPWSELKLKETEAFAKLIQEGIPNVMVGHGIIPGLTEGVPASHSPEVYDYLRKALKFKGVAITDALNMKGAAGDLKGIGSIAVESLKAGADQVIIDFQDVPVVQRVVLKQINTPGSNLSKTVNTKVQRIFSRKGVKTC